MNSLSAQEIKRRGISAVDDPLKSGPVRIIKNNKPKYVVMSEKDYELMLRDLSEARVAASEKDIKAGRIFRGNASRLMKEIKRAR